MIWNLLLQGGMGFFGYNIFQINVRGVLMCLVITAIAGRAYPVVTHTHYM